MRDQRLGERVRGRRLGRRDDQSGHDPAPLGIGCARDRAFEHCRMPGKRRLDLGDRDIVAGGDDHVVGPALIGNIALAIDAAEIAGKRPAIDDRARLIFAI